MLRRLLHGLFVAVAVITGLCAAAVVGTWIWLRTDAGQRFVLERLRAPLRAQGMDLDADRVSGTLFSSLRLNGMTVRVCAQKISIHARSMEVRYGLPSILRGAPVIDVTVEDPVVAASDVPCAAALGGAAPSLPRRVVLRSVEIHGGVVGSGNRRLTALEMVGDGVVNRDDAGGAPALTFHIAKASARIFSEHSHLELSGQIAPEQIDVDLTAAVARDDLLRHAAGAASVGPVAAHLHVAGPPGALRLKGDVKTALGEAEVSGTIDAPGREAELALATKRLVIAPAGSDVEIAASARVRMIVAPGDKDKDGVRLALRGRGDYTRRGYDPSLDGASMKKHLVDLPGGSWSGSAQGSADGEGLSTRFHIDLTSEGKREAAPASIVLTGKLIVPRAGRPRLEANVAAKEAVNR